MKYPSRKAPTMLTDERRPRPSPRVARSKQFEPGASERADSAADEHGDQLPVVVAEHKTKVWCQVAERRTPGLNAGQNHLHGGQSPRRTIGATRRPHRRGPGGHRLLHGGARPGGHRPAGGVRHVRASRIEPRRGVQRGAHPGHDAGDRRVPRRAGHDGPAVHRPRHPRAVRARVGLGAGGAGRQRRGGDDRRGRPLHPDPGGQPRHPGVQPRPRHRPGRRHRRHPVAQPAARRRLQVQPAQRRSRRHRCHGRDRQARQRDTARRPGRREADPAGAGAADARSGTTT